MAVFRVEKTRDFTVMSNHHLRNRCLTLKAKGLLSLILSLPENWDYTTRGLAAICKENKDTIGKIINELIDEGYIVRHQERGEGGKLGKCVYTIYESPRKSECLREIAPHPKKPDTVKQATALSGMDKPAMVKPQTVSSDIINTNRENKEKEKTKERNIDINNPTLFSSSHGARPHTEMEAKERKEKIRSELQEQIGYYDLKGDYPNVGLVDEVFGIMLEIMESTKAYWYIGGENVPTWELQERMGDITCEQVELIIDSYLKQTVEIKKPKSYLVKCLYNVTLTSNAYWDNQTRVDGVVPPDGLYKN